MPQHVPQPPASPRGDSPEFILSKPLRARLRSGGIWAGTAFLGTISLNVAVSALATRLLTPEDAGIYFLILSIVTATASIAQLGLNRAAVRLISDALADVQLGRARSTVKLVAGAGVSSAVVVAVISLLEPTRHALLAAFSSPPLASTSLLIGLLIGARVLGLLRAEVFRGFHDLRSASAFQGLDWYILTTALLAALLVFTSAPTSLSSVLWLTLFAWFPGLVIGWWLLALKTARIDGTGSVTIRELATLAWPLWIAGVGSIILVQGDMWVAGVMVPASSLALYGAAHRLIQLMSAPLRVVNSVLQPIMVELYSTGQTARLQKVLRASSTLAGIPSAMVLVSFIFAGGTILSVVFGDFYSDAWIILGAMSGGYLVNVAVGSCGFLLMMSGYERTYMLINVLATLAMVGSAIALSRYFGAVGIAGAAGGGHALKNLLAWLAARRLTGVSTHVGIRPGVDLARDVLCTKAG